MHSRRRWSGVPGLLPFLKLLCEMSHAIPLDISNRLEPFFDDFLIEEMRGASLRLHAPFAGGELVTRTIIFAGNRLHLNLSTSAAGSVRVEVQTPEGKAVEGFALDDCYEVTGDDLRRTVAWKRGYDVSTLMGKPIRLRFRMKDADLYSLQFGWCRYPWSQIRSSYFLRVVGPSVSLDERTLCGILFPTPIVHVSPLSAL